jgi:5,10-methylenetetrahydrofolate reductase
MISFQGMKVSYELNPPKIIRGNGFDLDQLTNDLKVMGGRASQLAELVDGIHLTDSVLGIPRISSVTAAAFIQKLLGAGAVRIGCSLRVRDRNFTALSQAVSDAILAGVENLLVLLGDRPPQAMGDSGLKPSTAVTMLKKEGYDQRIKLDLSFPAKKSDCPAKSVQAKLDARPHSFVTQSISSLSDLGEIVDLAKPCGIKVAAVIMVPAEKNRQSAKMIGLDWSGYEKNPVDFVKNAGRIADRILITSPNSFRSGLELLNQLK